MVGCEQIRHSSIKLLGCSSDEFKAEFLLFYKMGWDALFGDWPGLKRVVDLLNRLYDSQCQSKQLKR